ncbi:hypothetical protein [Streptomyces sp. NBC_01803]|uniref:hypothetical protein n=1 Tax=Streptomyces sp. NBC_01803 TaxID=2975946 RepID=UPI002DD951AC|nr:hypothetical protein [Streptomyces sp. NBC_01803]WSA42951.1 hypothetical protein OIE51_01270 [Streptomyces sp. NBC_01803]
MSRAGDYPAGTEHLEAESFSPRSHAGACQDCRGTGRRYGVSESGLAPDPSLSIRDGAIAAWPGAWHGKNLRDILDVMGIDVDVPFEQLDPATRQWTLFTDEQPVVTVYPTRDATEQCSGPVDQSGRTCLPGRSIGHRARPTLLRRPGRHVRAQRSERRRRSSTSSRKWAGPAVATRPEGTPRGFGHVA